jgi:hypothetical protein
MIKRRILILMLLLLSGGALADEFVGQASVVDGDTLEIHGIRSSNAALKKSPT